MKSKNPRTSVGGFGMTTKAVMCDPDISLKEKGLYAYLAVYADNVTNELTVSVHRMASECGVTESTVKRSLKILEEKQIIKRIVTGSRSTKITVLLK